jgi:hypothetical protein
VDGVCKKNRALGAKGSLTIAALCSRQGPCEGKKLEKLPEGISSSPFISAGQCDTCCVVQRNVSMLLINAGGHGFPMLAVLSCFDLHTVLRSLALTPPPRCSRKGRCEQRPRTEALSS